MRHVAILKEDAGDMAAGREPQKTCRVGWLCPPAWTAPCRAVGP